MESKHSIITSPDKTFKIKASIQGREKVL